MRITVLLLAACLSPLLQAQATFGRCQGFPANHILNTPVDKAPLHPASDALIKKIGANTRFHPDFGAQGSIPFNVVNGIPAVPVKYEFSETDNLPVPIPPEPKMERGDDRHMLVIDEKDCRLYELFVAQQDPTTKEWRAGTLASWDLNTTALRPDGWTSSDAAGLPIAPLLLQADEVYVKKEVKHALRFSVRASKRVEYLWPARHYASNNNDPNLPPLGLRVRLKANFDISKFSEPTRVILTGLKKYGMILADNGGDWFVQGVPDPRWQIPGVMDDELKSLKGADFEVVDTSGWQVNPNLGVAITEEFYLPSTLVEAKDPTGACAKVGQQWFNTTTSGVFFCVPKADGSRVWQKAKP